MVIMINLRTGNAAFEDGKSDEVARILRDIADRYAFGETSGVVQDVNGNTVGRYSTHAGRLEG